MFLTIFWVVFYGLLICLTLRPWFNDRHWRRHWFTRAASVRWYRSYAVAETRRGTVLNPSDPSPRVRHLVANATAQQNYEAEWRALAEGSNL